MSDIITNRYPQEQASVGENAKRLQQIVDSTNWKRVGKAVLIGHLAFLGVVFSTIVVVRAALHIF
jgi:hypothetical protein